MDRKISYVVKEEIGQVLLKYAKDLNVDPAVLPLEKLSEGFEVELEHGSVDARTDVTHDNVLMILKIALAHYEEMGPEYYVELKKMEERLEPTWKGKSIFKDRQ